MSTLRAALVRHRISVRAFSAPEVNMLLRSVKINKRTPAIQRSPVSVTDLRLIVIQFHRIDYSHHLQVAVLILFTMAFRQSNLAPASRNSFDRTRHLTWMDIRLTSSYVQVLEKWSKTRQQIINDRWLSVPRVPGSSLCLHSALCCLRRVSPIYRREQPLLVFDDGTPMPLSYINRCFKSALAWAGLSQRALTLHSLRRGGARYLQRAGVSTSDIASHGGWRSSAIYRYIQDPTKPAAFKALKHLQ